VRGVAEYNYDRVAEKTVELYESILAERERRSPPIGRASTDLDAAVGFARSQPL
jgi:hypothetical protein